MTHVPSPIAALSGVVMYAVTVSLIDFGGFVGIGPALGGTFSTLTPSPATDTAAATEAAPFTLTFVSATAPPPGAATLHVTNSPGAGDLFRSGLVTSLPAAPGTLTMLSFPTALTTLSATALAAMVAGRVGAVTLTPPPGVVAAVAAASLGTHIPLTGAITGVATTLTPASAGTPGSVTVTVTGVFTFRVYYLFIDTVTFTGTLVLTPAPSGDAGQPGRILSVPGTTTLASTTTGPSPTLALTGLFLSLMAPAVGAVLQPQIESALNAAIDGLVAPGLAGLGFRRSPSAVLSARRVTITGGSLTLALVLADLFGPAVSPVPGRLHATVAPTPQAATKRVYTVTVTNADTATPVNQADVTLRNFAPNGTAQPVGPVQTGTSGQATLNVALRSKIIWQVDPITHERTRIAIPPTLTVSKSGFDPFSRTLLADPGDL
jgi:hypothetical protein